jgi:magnesium-transporting ATPase (P-type)
LNKKAKFIFLVILVVVGRFYDAFTTSLYTSDLKKESNIVVNWFGGGWIAIIIIQTLLILIIIYCLFYYFFKFEIIKPTESNLTIKQFISVFHFNDKTSFWKIFYDIPKNKIGYFSMIGYVASMTLVFASYIVGTSTSFLILSDSYRSFYKHNIPYVLYGLIVIVAIYFTIRFYRKEYYKYKYGC